MENKRTAVGPQLDQMNRFERRAHAIIATMNDVAHTPETDRRQGDRQRFLAQAKLRWTDLATEVGNEMTLYTRDVTGHGVGYIAAGEVPAAIRGTVELIGPGGQLHQAEGQVIRVQAFATGWHEGYVRFDCPQNLFSEKPIRAA